MTAKEAAKYPGAERMAGTLLVCEVDDSDFMDIAPAFDHLHPNS